MIDWMHKRLEGVKMVEPVVRFRPTDHLCHKYAKP